MKNTKQDFPIFKNNPDLVYLDSSATAQKPQVVIDAVSNFYAQNNSNIHRGIYALSQNATDLFESVRSKVAKFINAASDKEIIFTSNTTEAINLASYGWARKFLKAGDIIVVSEMEHHSNLVPWMRLRDEIGVKLVYLPLNKDFRLDYKKVKVDFKKVKLIALAQASNVLGTVNPVSEIANFFKQNGSYAKLLIDAAQSIPHLPIDVQKLGADFLAFSSHKMLGPSGVGVLYAKKELLDIMDPLLVGSHIIKKVTKEKVTWTTAPDKFEPGTRNIEGVIGLGAAIDYLQQIGMEKIAVYEKELTTYALEMFKKHKITLFGPITFKNRLGVFSFAVGSVHPHDTAEILNRKNIAVRSGHHCAEPLMTCLGVSGTARASLYLYNTKEDVDKLFEGIELVKKTFKV